MDLSPEVISALRAKASGVSSTPSFAPVASTSLSPEVISALRLKASGGQTTPSPLSANQTSLGRTASVGQGLFGGFLDEAGAGIQSLGGYLGALSSGNKIPLSDIYNEQLAQNRQGLEEYKQADPTMSTALEIGGSVLSPINKIAKGGKIASAGLQGAIYGAGQAEGNENIISDSLVSGGLGAGGQGIFGLAGKGINAIASKSDDLAQSTKNKLFGIQYSDIRKSLDKDVRALGDTEAPIQKAINKLASEGSIKGGDALENLTAIETQIGDLGKQVKSVLSKADAVQPNPLIPDYKTTESYISKLDSDARDKARSVFLRLKKAQQNNVLLSDWELEKSALSKAGASTYGMQGVDALEANLKKYMAKDIKDAVDNELTNPLYKKALGTDYQNIKELRSAMADRFKVQGAFTKAVAREGSQDADSLITGLMRTTGGYGVPMLIGAGSGGYSGGAEGALIGAGAGLALRSNTGKKALVKAFEQVGKKGATASKALEAIAPVTGQVARTVADDLFGNETKAYRKDSSKISPTQIQKQNKIEIPLKKPTPDLIASQPKSDLVKRVIMQESSGNPKAVGPQTKYGRAKGAMQLLDSTAKETMAEMGLNPKDWNPFDENLNIAVGSYYLDKMLKKYNGNESLALAAYNWGIGNVDKYLKGQKSFVPLETQKYVEKIAGRNIKAELNKYKARYA